MYAIDFETYLISEEAPYPKPVCLSYADSKAQGVLAGKDMELFLHSIIDEGFIAHNATFECLVIWHHFPSLHNKLVSALQDKRIICTKIVEQYKNNSEENKRFKFSLADLVQHYFNKDISAGKTEPDAWRLRYHELDGLPVNEYPKEAYEYSLMDSVWAHRVFEKQLHYSGKCFRQMEASFWLNLMGCGGIKVDVQRAKELEDDIYTFLAPVYQRLIAQKFLSPSKGKRPKKNNKILQNYVEENVENVLFTAKKNIAVDKEALLRYHAETEDSLFEDLATINQYDKIITAYTPNLINSNGLIRSQYSTGKTTGRTSSSGTRFYPSVNIQQMPREVQGVKWDVRNCFVPREGYKLLAIDYAGLELVSCGHQLYSILGHSSLRDTINARNTPTDLHSKLAAAIMSIEEGKEISYDEFVCRKGEKEFKAYRQLCKAINLGFPGGIGFDTMRTILLQQGVRTFYKELIYGPSHWSLKGTFKQAVKEGIRNLRIKQVAFDKWSIVQDELVGIKAEFLKLYPELAYFLRDHHKKGLTGAVKWKKNDFGQWEEEPMYQYDVMGFKRGWCNYTAYCNGVLMQTPSAVGATRMLNYICPKYVNNQDVNILAFIHDELLFEIHHSQFAKYERELAEDMIDGMQSTLSSVRITVETSGAMDYWDKAGGEKQLGFFKNAGCQKLRNM